MKYVSTRGHGNPVTFEDTLFLSCPDGGLFVPQSVPKIDPDTLREWSKLTFVDMAKRITRRFISEEEISTDVLDGCLDRAFGSFSHPEVTPVTRLPGGLNVMELHHGKTLAFKDLALSCVGQFFRHFLAKRRKRVVIVVVTSGDTGSAAIEGVRGNEWVDIVVFLPENGCSRAQVLQMVTVTDDNVHVFKIRAPLSRVDDARDIIACDEAFCEEHGFTSINSTNWSRIMIQIIHYFYGYFQVCGEVGEEVEVAVPTGAAGNIAGGLFAREMGLPVRFVSGVNVNNIFARGLSTGGYSRRDVTATIASAMDIENPYNMERVLYVLSGGDHALINRLFEEFGKTGACNFPEALLKKVSSGLKTHTAHDQRIEEVMRRCWAENNYAICPHTAVGVSYFYQQQDSTNPGTEVKPTVLCVSTASPAKFSEVLEAAGVPPQTNSKLAGLDEKPRRFSTVEADENYEQFLRACVSEITQRRRAEDSGQSSH